MGELLLTSTWCFWIVVLEKTLESLLDCEESQPVLKGINPGCSLEGLMLKLKLQYLATSCEELTHWKRPWCWVRLKAGGEGDNREWDGWMATLTQWTWIWVGSKSWWWARRPGMRWFMGSQRVRHNWDWIELNMKKKSYVDNNKLCKILQAMGKPDHFTCLLRNLYSGQEPTVKTRHGTTDWFQIGKGVGQGCIFVTLLI